MNFEEFVAHQRAMTEKFEEWWKEHMKEQPERFPAEMDFSDWYEQFLIYCENNE